MHERILFTLLLSVAITVSVGEIAEVCSPGLPVTEESALASQMPALPGASWQGFSKEGQFQAGHKTRLSFSWELQAAHLCLERRPGALEMSFYLGHIFPISSMRSYSS